jgi:multidrug efflux pump subunit AcrB
MPGTRKIRCLIFSARSFNSVAENQGTFEKAEDQVTYNNLPTAFLKIRKNTQDDSLRILETVKQFISDEKRRLPAQVRLNFTDR